MPRSPKEVLIHVHAAHLRLSRIAEKTGRDVLRLCDVIDLLIAIGLTDGSSR